MSNLSPGSPGPFSLADYDYFLPADLIAQQPSSVRDHSRLMVLGEKGDMHHHRFDDIAEFLSAGDVLVVNDTKVFPARLLGKKKTGGKVELFLLDYPGGEHSGMQGEKGSDAWTEMESWGLLKSSKGARPGMDLFFGEDLRATVLEVLEGGKVRVLLRFRAPLDVVLLQHGRMPLPPYIHREGDTTETDRRRYQTVFANKTGAVAAPTAGLHFTPDLLEHIRAKGVQIAHITLHVGYGTFAPVREEDLRRHRIHAEYVEVSAQSAALINQAREGGHAVWPVGTTSVRTLEWATDDAGRVQPVSGLCDLYIFPGYAFRLVDRLITNFHLPKSSLLFLVSALAGYDRIRNAYAEAVKEKYRFFSYGDAMVILPE